MSYVFHAGAAVAIVSGAALVVLGLLALRLRPWRLPALAFSAFAVLWGIQVAAVNVARMAADPATAEPLVLAFAALLIPLYLPVLLFVAVFPRPWKPVSRPVVLGLAGVPAAVLLLLLASSPRLFVEAVAVNAQGRVYTQFGPVLAPLSAINSVLCFVIAHLFVTKRMVASTAAAERAQLSLVAAALSLYVANRAALLVEWGVMRWSALSDAFGLVTYGLFIAAYSLALVAVVAIVVVVWRRRDLPWRSLILASATVPFGVGVAEAFIRNAGATAFDTVGLWRLLMVALFAYAIARYRLFDIELKLKDAAPVVAYVLATIIGLVTIWVAFGDSFSNVPLLGITASLGVAAVCVPAVSLGRVAMRRAAPHLDEPEYLYKRKMDVYRAALEEAQAKGMGKDTEQVFLTDLRRRLSITEAEHRVLLLVLESQERYEKRQPIQSAPAKFHIERELGRGSFGRAVLARDTVLDRPVVLKQPLAPWMLDEEGRKLFLQEAKLAARINHPNVVQVYEILPDADPPMLVLEYVEGGSLETLLEQGGVLAPDRVVAVGLDVLAGLEQIHKAGIVHRDLKPANILLTNEGRAKVTDFGIAHAPPSFNKAVTAAATGIQPGSLAYMSPEQARGDAVDKRSDLYSVGVVLYQAATGRFYIDLGKAGEYKGRQLIQDAKPRPLGTGVPKRLSDAILKALEKDPDERFETAGHMAKALKARERASSKAAPR